MVQKSYSDNKNTLYIIPTPIGNIDDITFRALKLLKEVDVIFAEDTRTTNLLLSKFEIKNKVKTCQKFTEISSSKEIIEYLKSGMNVALVSDRGTPLISDPGYLVTKEVIKAGFNVVALPGACAFIPALNMSGINAEKFLFYGFLSNKNGEQEKELEMLKNINFTIVLYEAPHRLDKTLQNILKIMGNRSISISREITKIYEEVFRGTVTEALEFYKEVKGEIVIVIDKIAKTVDYESYLKDVNELVSLGLSSKDAIKYIVKKYNISKNILYNMYEETKK